MDSSDVTHLYAEQSVPCKTPSAIISLIVMPYSTCYNRKVDTALSPPSIPAQYSEQQ